LDAADSSVVTIATGVSQWRDKSGNGNNLTQSTTGAQPTHTSSLITFESNKYLNIPTSVLNNLSTWSVFFVINPISSSNWILAKQRDGVNTYNVLSMTVNTATSGAIQTGSTGFLYWRSMNAGTQAVSTAAITTSTLQVINLTYDGTNLYFYKNGVLEKTTAGTFAIQNDTTPSTYTLGVSIYPGGQILNPGTTNFSLGEMLVYTSAITTSQRQQVEGYLAHKWGLVAPSPTTPLSVPGCQLWLDAADSSTVTGTTTVTQWRDKSGNARHLSAGSGTTSYSSNAIQVNNSYLYVESPVDLSKVTVFIVVKTAGGGNQTVFSGRPQSTVDWSSVDGFGFFMDNQTAVRVYGQYDGVSTFSVNTSTPQVFSFQSSGTSLSAWYNGISQPGATFSSTRTSTAQGFAIGASWSGSLYNNIVANASVYEAITYNTILTTTQRQTVETYLAKKWSIGSASMIPSSHPFYKIPPHLRLFKPNDVTGCQLWLDGADQGSMTFSGSTITQWSDKSGNGYHATIASGRIGATYSSGLKCVYFQSPSVGYQTNYPANPTNETMFVVANIDSPSSTNNNTLICGQQGARSLGVGWNGGDATTCAYLNSHVSWRVSTPSGSYTAGTTALITGQVSSGTSLSIAMNGATFSTGSEGGFYANTTTHLGVDTTTTAYYYKGFVMEILFYNSVLTTTQRQQVEGYLAHKWGLSLSIPSTHPFKSIPPASLHTVVIPPTVRLINLGTGSGGPTSGLFAMNSLVGGGTGTFTNSDVFMSDGGWGMAQCFDGARSEYDLYMTQNPNFMELVFPRGLMVTKIFLVPRQQQDAFPSSLTLKANGTLVGTYTSTTVSQALGMGIGFTGQGFYIQPDTIGTTWRFDFTSTPVSFGEIEFWGYLPT
jgi:hypothetical protein